jgi:hypothetical protein
VQKTNWPLTRHKIFRLVIVTTALLFGQDTNSQTQDRSIVGKVFEYPDKMWDRLAQKAADANSRLEKASVKWLQSLQKEEMRLMKRLKKLKPELAARLRDSIAYDALLKQPVIAASRPMSNDYSPRLDSLTTSLQFLQQQNLIPTLAQNEKLKALYDQYGELQARFNHTHKIESLIAERKEVLRKKLQSLGLSKEMKRFQSRVYYYKQQLDEYRQLWENPQALERKLVDIALKLPAFQNFFGNNSQLGAIFRLPGADPMTPSTIQGLQTRTQLMQQMQGTFGTNVDPQQYVTAGVDQAQSQLNDLKAKLQNLAKTGGDITMPDFTPNSQKSKSFLKRLELGFNIQSTKNNRFFPTTSDIGLSAGYKINDRSIAGVGVSYKIGFGSDMRHIRITHEGVGLRSFVDVKLKGSIWISGGGELNYRSAFSKFDELKDYNAWQRSGLLGVSKKYTMKKLTGKLQLLYDFLHARQVPATQPLVFRFGYTF